LIVFGGALIKIPTSTITSTAIHFISRMTNNMGASIQPTPIPLNIHSAPTTPIVNIHSLVFLTAIVIDMRGPTYALIDAHPISLTVLRTGSWKLPTTLHISTHSSTRHLPTLIEVHVVIHPTPILIKACSAHPTPTHGVRSLPLCASTLIEMHITPVLIEIGADPACPSPPILDTHCMTLAVPLASCCS
jgi:hypothetical protein